MNDRSKGKPLRKKAEWMLSKLQDSAEETPSGDVRMHSINTKDDAENLNRIQSVIIDITKLKKKEQALQLERNRLKSILDTIQDGVYIESVYKLQHDVLQ